MLTLLDALLSEYSWTIGYAMAVPLCQAFALYAAMQVRYGNVFRGPTYGERALIEAAHRLPAVFEAANIQEAAARLRALQEAGADA